MISIRALGHSHPDGPSALEGIDLDVARGSCLLVCGANGSGKTTLLRHLNGLLLPTRGRVEVDGCDIRRDPDRGRELVGLVFQDPDAQIIGETVLKDALFGPENLGLPREEALTRARAALSRFGLSALEDRGCHLLSGGEKRRLSLAAVMAMDPPVLALDEPFASLDFPGVQDLLEHLHALKAEGRTLVLASHDVEKAWSLADRVALLQAGRLVAAGTREEVRPHLAAAGVRPPGSAWRSQEGSAWVGG